MSNHHHDKSDSWTNFAAVGEAVSSFISDAYWLASCFDVASGFDDDVLGLSYYAVGFGVFLALLSAGGAAYCHRNLNTLHQNNDESKAGDGQELGCPVANESSPLISNRKLSFSQKVALIGDFISHTGDIAGPCTFVVSLATHNNVPRWGKGVAQLGASLFGGLASVANVRTCKNALVSNRQ